MNKIEFGGETISVIDLPNNDKLLEYNSNSVLLSSIIEYVNSPFKTYRLSKTLSISKEGNKIHIGCLTDTNEKFKNLINHLI